MYRIIRYAASFTPTSAIAVFELREFLRALQCGAECAPLHRLRTSRVHPNADRPAHVPYPRNTSPSRQRTTQRTDLRHAARLALVPHPWGTIPLRRRTSQRVDLQLPPPEKT